MTNPQGWKHSSLNFDELCQHIYEAFGAYAVVHLVENRQKAGVLLDVTWADCNGCDWHSPIWDNACLVCGSQ